MTAPSARVGVLAVMQVMEVMEVTESECLSFKGEAASVRGG